MNAPATLLGPYALGPALGSGSSGVVHLGVRRGPLGFRRLVAVKRLHPELSRDPDAVAMLLEEGRLSALVRHPLVVPTLDVIDGPRGVALVSEYVDGLSLAALRNEGWPPPPSVAIAIARDLCDALAALHGAQSFGGEPLGIVHRDVAPKNVLVGADGYARLIDLGVAKAHRRGLQTASGGVKGTLAYLAPEQIDGQRVDARTDVFAAGVLLWELTTGERAFADTPLSNRAAAAERLARPSALRHDLSPAIDAVVLRALAPRPDDRFVDAAALATALTAACPPASRAEVAAWVQTTGSAALLERRAVARALTHEAVAGEEGSTTTVDGLVDRRESSGAAQPARRRRSRARSPWLVASFAVAIAVGWALGRGGSVVASIAATSAPAPGGFAGAGGAIATPAPVPPAPSSPATQTVVEDASPRPPAAPAALAPTTYPVAPASSPSPAPSPALSAPPLRATAARPPTPPAHSTSNASSAAPGDPCSPPFTVDERGVRKFKVECL